MTAYNPGLEAKLNEILDILGTTKTLLVPGWEAQGTVVSAIGAAGFAASDEAGTNALQTYFSPHEMPCGLHHYGFVKTENHNFSGADNAAFTFDGGTDAAFSGGLWYRPNVAVLAQDLISKYEAAAEEYRFGIDASGYPFLELHDATDSTKEVITGLTVLTPGQFVFVVFTYDGSVVLDTPVVNIYINAVDDAAARVQTGAYLHMDNTATPLTIGCSSLTATPANEADGRLAIPFLCGKQLTAAEVLELYGIMAPMVGLV